MARSPVKRRVKFNPQAVVIAVVFIALGSVFRQLGLHWTSNLTYCVGLVACAFVLDIVKKEN